MARAGKEKAVGKKAATPGGTKPPAGATGAGPKGRGRPEAAEGEPPAAGSVKLKDLLAQVAAATGGKPAAVRPAVDATLAALGEALSAGKSLNLPPLGRLRVTRNRDVAGGAMIQLRLRRGSAPRPAADAAAAPLAEPGEDG